ncbi:MAG: hypothetical protein WBP86_01440, partial [Thiobacillaceae bacterium]
PDTTPPNTPIHPASKLKCAFIEVLSHFRPPIKLTRRSGSAFSALPLALEVFAFAVFHRAGVVGSDYEPIQIVCIRLGLARQSRRGFAAHAWPGHDSVRVRARVLT